MSTAPVAVASSRARVIHADDGNRSITGSMTIAASRSPASRHRRLERGDVVERHAAEITARSVGHARGLVGRPIEPAEVSAPDDDVARRVRARDAHRGGDRLGAGLEKLHLVGARNHAAQPLGDVHFAHVRQRRARCRPRSRRRRRASRSARRSRARPRRAPSCSRDTRCRRRRTTRQPTGLDVVRRTDGVVGAVERRGSLAAGRRAGRQYGRARVRAKSASSCSPGMSSGSPASSGSCFGDDRDVVRETQSAGAAGGAVARPWRLARRSGGMACWKIRSLGVGGVNPAGVCAR